MPLKDGESFINSRLSGRALPEPGAAAGIYKPFVRRRNLLAVSGQLPIKDGEVAYRGALRGHHDIRKGVAAAELAVLNLLAQLNRALEGDLERLEGCLRLGGFVAAVPSFISHSKVMDGASQLLKQALGKKGDHARVAMGVTALPLDATVEVEGLFAVGD